MIRATLPPWSRGVGHDCAMVVRRGERARIGVVDDHPSIVAGLRAILGDQPDLMFSAGAATVSELLAMTRDLDLVVLDLRLEDGSSPQMNVDRLGELGIPAVAYTSGDEPYLVRLAASAGVKAVLRKNVDDDVLLAAIRAVLSGEETPTVDWAAAIDADDGRPESDQQARARCAHTGRSAGDGVGRTSEVLWVEHSHSIVLVGVRVAMPVTTRTSAADPLGRDRRSRVRR